MKQELEAAIAECAAELHDFPVNVELSRSDEQFGDYATNVAMKLAGRLQKPPLEIAEVLAAKLKVKLGDKAKDVAVAPPGFLNITLSDASIMQSLSVKPQASLEGKVVVAEYSDPSSFKVLHAGHLYTSIVGDAIANLQEVAGGKVHRVNFGGDVGLHVAKTMWAILRELGGEKPEKLDGIPEGQHADWMSTRYVEGNAAYEENSEIKSAIEELNKRVYEIHSTNDHDSPFARIYWTCRKWSYDYFDQFYARIGSHFEKYYPESQTMVLGMATVLTELDNGVYERSDGAIVFRGEKYGLHTRVFINSQGLPTYETKDVGLIMQKWQDYHYDKSIILTDNGQEQYMAVVLKSVEQFRPRLTKSTVHLTHGRVKLAGGLKMSSRKGNIVRAVDVLDIAAEANKTVSGHDNEQTVLGAVKYAFLKQRIGADIIYDPKESVSMEGNSGPYLQYAHARARSIMKKASSRSSEYSGELEKEERSLARKMGEYSEVVDRAVNEMMPHYVCVYLYELAQIFNRFYEHNRVINDPREAIRLLLVEHYANTLQSGLTLLGIPAPSSM
jgi:arginyl-tRNA synthetase